MEAVYPSSASALARGRRARRTDPRSRRRTVPVTFAEIKEVDEDNEEASVEAVEERRRRPDVLDERLARTFAEFRRRRAPRRGELSEREPDEGPVGTPAPAQGPPAPPIGPPRAGSEPSALHAPADT